MVLRGIVSSVLVFAGVVVSAAACNALVGNEKIDYASSTSDREDASSPDAGGELQNGSDADVPDEPAFNEAGVDDSGDTVGDASLEVFGDR